MLMHVMTFTYQCNLAKLRGRVMWEHLQVLTAQKYLRLYLGGVYMRPDTDLIRRRERSLSHTLPQIVLREWLSLDANFNEINFFVNSWRYTCYPINTNLIQQQPFLKQFLRTTNQWKARWLSCLSSPDLIIYIKHKRSLFIFLSGWTRQNFIIKMA